MACVGTTMVRSRMDTMPGCSFDSLKDLNSRISHTHSKKVIRHALRQQAKHRRKAGSLSGSSGALSRIVVKGYASQPDAKETRSATAKPSTMREVLASIPGFSLKPRRRTSKKLSAAAQLEQTKEGCIDLETPDSILVNTNLRALLNKHTFSILPPLYQYKLVQLLPDVDRAGVPSQPDATIRLSASGLNNEFFARACHEWRERLAEGEFTPENQMKLKAEAEKEMSRLDPWKLKHFEPIWGAKTSSMTLDSSPLLLSSNQPRPSLKTTIKLRPSTSAAGSKQQGRPIPRQLRTVGAITRAITSYREEADGGEARPGAAGPPANAPEKSEKRAIDAAGEEEPAFHKKRKSSSSAEVAEVDVLGEDVLPTSESEAEQNQRDVERQIGEQEVESSALLENDESYSGVEVGASADQIQPLIDENIEVGLSVECRSSPDVAPVAECGQELLGEVCHQEKSVEAMAQCQLLPREETAFETVEVTVQESVTVEVGSEEPCAEQVAPATDHQPDNLSDGQPVNHNSDIHQPDHHRSDDVNAVSNLEDETCNNIVVTAIETEVDVNIPCDVGEGHSVSCVVDEHSVSCIVKDNNSLDCVEEHFVGRVVEEHSVSCAVSKNEPGEVSEECFSSNRGKVPGQVDEVSRRETKDICGEGHIIFKDEKSQLVTGEDFLVPNDYDGDAGDCSGDHMSYEPKVEHEDDVIHESAILRGSEFVLNGRTCSGDAAKDAACFEAGAPQGKAADEEEEDAEEGESLYAVAVGASDECWDAVDSSTEKLIAEVPIVALESVPVPVALTMVPEGAGDEVKVIPMQEELEVRLEEGTFPVAEEALSLDWPYAVKMESALVAAALGSPEEMEETAKCSKPQYSEYSTSPGVKLELEVTLTPEAVTGADSSVTSSVAAAASLPAVSTAGVATVIPPTTIVCLPPAVGRCCVPSSVAETAAVASSSSVPYLALTSTTPIRALPGQLPKSQAKPKPPRDPSQVTPGSSGRNSRSASKPPPGAVNLERSYQICQAVIQNSPNRDQLRCQLKPPPSLLAAGSNGNAPGGTGSASKKPDCCLPPRATAQTQYGLVTSSRGGGRRQAVHPAVTGARKLPARPEQWVGTGAGAGQSEQFSHGRVPAAPAVAARRRETRVHLVARHPGLYGSFASDASAGRT
ncbi:polycomb protein Asx-like [Bacillus rossius redtenbacheri]|uniref:polycomb protein Asx-like n=1 Tax=Bacillus rossius redtenbacheri TaxID=93214 RepID=UPI002FDEBEB4